MATVTWENVLVLNENVWIITTCYDWRKNYLNVHLYHSWSRLWFMLHLISGSWITGAPYNFEKWIIIIILQPSSVWQEKMYDTIQTMVLKWWLTQQSELELIYFHTLNRVRPLLHNHQQEISSLSKQRDSNTFTCELVCPTVQYEQLHIYFTPTARDLICVKSFLQLRNPK